MSHITSDIRTTMLDWWGRLELAIRNAWRAIRFNLADDLEACDDCGLLFLPSQLTRRTYSDGTRGPSCIMCDNEMSEIWEPISREFRKILRPGVKHDGRRR